MIFSKRDYVAMSGSAGRLKRKCLRDVNGTARAQLVIYC